MISSKKCFVFLLIFFFVFSSVVFAEGAPLEVDSDGKVNIDYVLNLTPTELPPENPAAGDIYLTTDHQLLLFTDHWIKIMTSDVALNMGVVTKTIPYTTTGTWVVPPSINNITVTLVAGGRAGSGGSGGGGSGGGAGEIITQNITVSPGDSIVINLGSSNQNSSFGSMLTARSGYGTPGTAGAPAHNCVDTKGTIVCTPGSGGHGGGGYEYVSLAGAGGSFNYDGSIIPGGSGGVGYGAGGGGGAGGAGGGAGAIGYCLISYEATKYQLPDGTTYYEQ